MKNGLSGNIAKGFLQSKLTILLMIAFLLIGGYSTFLIPREEEPQIKVPMADIFIGYPGASPKDVETKVAAPLEKVISNIKGVEYVYGNVNSETRIGNIYDKQSYLNAVKNPDIVPIIVGTINLSDPKNPKVNFI